MPNTSSPKWNDEQWLVRNIPTSAKLFVTIYDKDDVKITDDYVGLFEIENIVNYQAPEDGHNIIGPLNKYRGRFHLFIEAIKSSIENQQLPAYTYDGPCRYSRHDDFFLGHLTMLNSNYVYSTWKIQLRRIAYFFGYHERHHWNLQSRNAKIVFGDGSLSLATQASLKLAHRTLYRRTLKNTENGRLTNSDDLWKSVFINKTTERIKPCVYTYIIDDCTWRFSETGHKIFADFASKHVLLANAAEYVRYAGEFHPRPKFGWDRCDDEWELVFDNASGTYTPRADLFTNLKELLLFNFPGLNVVTYDFRDPLLKESIEQLKLAAEK
ncbi:unnamed protein product [Rotaria sp. Silwood1]|nr:unnamed protein product [Rotaria sp. Silwood1]CAF0864369.1 unnamed protein product [Rotaria sp. Silwood1]CAF3365490.1 unnamed protein product [Rotaria sp. Silwood1]CAF3388149.1 unnamed protein product [Rotaria sp. Silwood1]CAF4822439.1 unnamed protein product [Rotaria sp. Silwood1]